MILIISAVPFLFLDHILFFTALLFVSVRSYLRRLLRLRSTRTAARIRARLPEPSAIATFRTIGVSSPVFLLVLLSELASA